jgi:hypothetical protein
LTRNINFVQANKSEFYFCDINVAIFGTPFDDESRNDDERAY